MWYPELVVGGGNRCVAAAGRTTGQGRQRRAREKLPHVSLGREMRKHLSGGHRLNSLRSPPHMHRLQSESPAPQNPAAGGS